MCGWLRSHGRWSGRVVSVSHDLLPWYDQVDWMADPRLAYLRGLQDGVELGREQADRELVIALAEALSSGATTDYGAATRIHERTVAARERRTPAAAEQAALNNDSATWGGQYPGGRVDFETGAPLGRWLAGPRERMEQLRRGGAAA